MKIIRKVLLVLLILFVVLASILFIVGYSYYSEAIKEKPLVTRVEEIQKKEHFVKFDNLSKNYINAVIAIEDHRYYDHGPVDFIAIGRALFSNIKEGELEQGGSTITQQVAKNVVFNQEQSFIRKLAEIMASFDLEKNFSKNDIFEIYVNTAYFGEGQYGIYDASQFYYKKEPKDLDLNEASMLAGVPNAPSVYAPTINPVLAKQRQTQVIKAMVDYGFISNAEANTIL